MLFTLILILRVLEMTWAIHLLRYLSINQKNMFYLLYLEKSQNGEVTIPQDGHLEE